MNNIKGLVRVAPQLTDEQGNVVELIKRGESVIVNATAGSGKTFTTIEAMYQVAGRLGTSSKSLGMVFNKSRQIDGMNKTKDLRNVGYDVEYKTYHSLGLKILTDGGFPFPYVGNRRAYMVSSSKYYWLAQQLIRNTHPLMDDAIVQSKASSLQQMVDLCQMNLVVDNPDDVLKVADHFGKFIENPMDVIELLRWGIDDAQDDHMVGYGKRRRNGGGRLSFGDMPYLAWRFRDRIETEKYDFIAVDEGQDFTRLASEIVGMVSRTDTQHLVVGDDQQAIQGFAGADNKAMEMLGTAYASHELPMTYTFRCPDSHTQFVRSKVLSQITTHDSVSEGEVVPLTAEEMAVRCGDGDMVLHRTNKDTTWFALELLAMRKPAVIVGKTTGAVEAQFKQFTNGNGRSNWSNIRTDIANWLDKKLKHASDEDKADEYREQAQIANMLITAFPASSRAQFVREIEGVFVDDIGNRRDVIACSTVHKAKGGEADNVWLPDLTDVTGGRSTTDWQHKQKDNLLFVAMTRAKKVLGYNEGN